MRHATTASSLRALLADRTLFIVSAMVLPWSYLVIGMIHGDSALRSGGNTNKQTAMLISWTHDGGIRS